MSIQGPNQPEPKVPLSQLKNMADIDGDGKLRGSELLIFQSACEASGYDGISINLYNEDEPVATFKVGQDTFSTNGKQDAKTYKNSRDEVDDAVGRNSRKTKKEVMAAYQTGASQIVGLVKQVPVDKRSEFIAYLDDLFQTNGPAKYSSAEDCSQVMNTLYKAVQAKIQKDYSTTTGAPSPMPVQPKPDTPLAEVPEVPTPTAGLPAEERPTFDPSSIDKATRAKANETIRSWGEKTNKIPREALGGEFGENNTADKVVDLVLAKMNITNMSDEQKASLRQSVIDANPSVFDKDGNVYANADLKKLDFPTAAAINHVFMGGDAPASKSSAAVEQKPDVDKTEANKPKTGDYSLADLNEIVKTRNPKNYVTQNGDKFTMYIYEKDDRRVTPFVGSKAAIVQTLKEMGTDMSVSAKDNGSTAVSGGQTPVPVKQKTDTSATAVGKAIYDIADKKSGDESAAAMKQIVMDQISTNNVVEVWDSYKDVQSSDSSILSTFTSENLGYGKGKGRDAAQQATRHIINQLNERAKAHMGDSAVSAALNALNNSLKDANLSLWRDGWQIDTKGFNLRTDSALSSRFEGLIDNLVAAIKDAEAPKYAPFKEELEQTVQFKEKTGNYTATLMVSGKPMTISARSTSMSGISSLEQNSAIENLRAEAQKLGFKDPSRLTFVQVY